MFRTKPKNDLANEEVIAEKIENIEEVSAQSQALEDTFSQSQENSEQEVNSQENQTEAKKDDVDQEECALKDDKFSLAGLLGKTESGMKSDFYAYQIKELMQSVGTSLPKGYISVSEIENCYKQTIKYGGKELILTPYLFKQVKQMEENINGEKLNLSVIVDYPYGESSFKAKLLDVKESIKNGASSVTVVMAKRSVSTANLSTEKAMLNKLTKVGKGKVGIAINLDIESEDFKKVVKLIDGIKATHVTLLAEDVSLDRIKQAIETLSLKKIDKKIFVYTSISKVQELSALIETKVNKVYTEHFGKIGIQLEEKFEIQI